MYLVLGPEAAWGSSPQVCTLTRQSVLPYTALWSPYSSPPTQTPSANHFKTLVLVSACVRGRQHNTQPTTLPTLGCRAYHSSIWESNSQESKVSSTSPRKLLCPKRSWCHTDTCRVRVSSCEWLITYCTAQGEHGLSDVKLKYEFASLCFFPSTHPQILVENRINGVGLDARLPLALPWRVWQQVSLHITSTKWKDTVTQSGSIRGDGD